jgi:carboxyl-terminal processing protease
MNVVRRPSWRILIVLAVLLWGVAPAPVMAARPHAAIPLQQPTGTAETAGNITRLATLVRNEYMEEVPPSKLEQGAYKGMREYLKKQSLNAAVVPETASKPNDKDFSELRHVFLAVMQKYPHVNNKQLSYAAIRGMLASLGDPYTVFLDPDEYKGLMGQLNGGNFGGLGIYIEADDKNNKALTVVEPMEGTPAMEAGIKARDVILEIDGKTTKGMALEDATKLLRGPVGSTVTLTLLRGAETLKIPVVRAVIRVKTLSYKIMPDKIGYIKLRVFGDNADEEMEEAFRAFDKAGVKGYILDLRNNGGGYITAALDVASKFLPTGSRVVSVAERGAPEIVYNSRPNMRPVLPMVVLINQYSASASEITAGALKDLHEGTLVGVKSFGKGSVQKIFPLPDGSALKVTTAHYHTPDGTDIHKKGINPDVNVPMKADEQMGDDKNDPQLKAAITLVENKMATSSVDHQQLAHVALRPDAIEVGSSGEEFDYIHNLKASDGSGFDIVDQSMVFEGGVNYDKVTLKSEKSGETKTLYFHSPFFGK